MKGIILAGGSGSRLYPTTKGISKQLLPIYDKPMIYYPVSILMLAKIKDILIVCKTVDYDFYYNLLGNGNKFGINIIYAFQDKPRGIVDGLIIAKKIFGDCNISLILGDNFLYGDNISNDKC